jgi:ATP-dependent DNA ligase
METARIDLPPSVGQRTYAHPVPPNRAALDSTDGETVFLHACRMGLEGIVAKRRDAPYRSGRCMDWIMVKNSEHTARARAMLIAPSKRRRPG